MFLVGNIIVLYGADFVTVNHYLPNSDCDYNLKIKKLERKKQYAYVNNSFT